jgi:lipopolysaccharide transport system ATP-binding protein
MNMATTHEDLFGAVAPPAAHDSAIIVDHVTKRFALFNRPEDRLKQMVVPHMQRLVRAEPSRYFREFSAVNDVSLTIAKGETIGIIGRNGSGKSTLLQMIVGTLAPTSGRVKVNGRIAALLELGAGFNPEFTGRENVYVNGAILGFSRAEMDERFEAIAAFAGIGEFIERPVKTYSSGMFVRLAFAVSTAVEPDILVVDEALSVGDEAFQRKCFARIEAIKERGGTILFVSHGAQTIVQLCDRAVLLDGGEKILEGEPKQVVGQYQRLINASEEREAQIKSEIIALRNNDIEKSTGFKKTEKIELEKNINYISEKKHNIQNSEEHFDNNLKSQSTVSLEERGAKIENIVIRNSKGSHVNTLVNGDRYIFEYNIQFFSAAKLVSCGFSIWTSQGLLLAGGHTSMIPSLKLKHVHSGDRFLVQFSFLNNFNPSVYFCACGVRGTIDDNEIVMHRLIDVYPFRVIDSTPSIGNGYFNLGLQAKIKIV